MTMPNIPTEIVDFLYRHHVVSLACHNQEQLWCASCFYTFDEKNHRLLVLTSVDSEHGKLMLANPNIVGTVAKQPERVSDIEGIQFRATARCLTESDEYQTALDCYLSRHKMAKSIPSDLWEIRFDYIKHTSNRLIFAEKQIWQAHTA